jgi:hypothetical protein
MAAKRSVAPATKRYPNLRLLVKLYKVFGVIALAVNIVASLVMFLMVLTGEIASAGLLVGLSLIFSGFAMAVLFWSIAERTTLATDVEENTRRSAKLLAQAARNAAPAGDAARSAAHLENVVRILEMTAVYQQQTNKRLEELSTELEAMRGDLTTGVQTLTKVAESSKVVATILYRQGVNHG